ncbi:cytochrome c [Roseovarius sp. EL26]|uniref:c-type cytochrome n=1 Tax=Roseovarius sp. EL26 TaxID=2126672 RepID=UPI000EA1429D|nr:cytochrome c [Roseovarius sp. EL26]
MKHSIQILTMLGCMTLVVPLAFAHSDVENPMVYDRIHAMEDMEKDRVTLSDMVQGRRGFDALAAEQARARLIRNSNAIQSLFKSPQMDPKTTALPLIWDRWPEFKAKAKTMQRAAKRLDVSSQTAVQSGLRELQAACQACHQVYRQSVN